MGDMYAIRYRTLNAGNECLRILGTWDEAMDVWVQLMTEPGVRIVPDRSTGCEIQPLVWGRKCKDMPGAFRLLLAS